jgi:uncharacterized membrane protein
MSWVFYGVMAIVVVGFSDIARKLASNLHDPFYTNLIFQTGSFLITVLLYVLFSRRFEWQPKDMAIAVAGGMLISVFTLLSFKALDIGPGVSVVMPALRIGGVVLVAVLGVVLLHEKLSMQSFIGLLLSLAGIVLLFTSK